MDGNIRAAVGAVVVAVAVAFTVLACADTEDSAAGAAEPFAPVTTVETKLAEQASLRELTRLVAIALQDQGLRQRIKNDMRSSRSTAEHKLEFRNYIRGNSGGILLAKMANESGRSREDLLALIDGIRPLEFYMPVKEHREGWRGGDDLLVVSALDEEGQTLVAYDLAGGSVPVSVTEMPSMPTLVLVPDETDFSKELDPGKYRNTNDLGGQTIGTYRKLSDQAAEGVGISAFAVCEENDPECEDDTGGPVDYDRRGVGVEEYISHMKTTNDHEPWHKGAPEFYLNIAGVFANGTPLGYTIWVDEQYWDGSDDEGNAEWREFDPFPLILWDTDLGNRIKVECWESDTGFNATQTVSGSSEFFGTGITIEYEVEFDVGQGTLDDDDNCGSTYVTLWLSNGTFLYIPDGDEFSPPPEYNSTSQLYWYGYGVDRSGG